MAPETKDINLLVKPRNARILRAMRASGFESVAQLCRGIGMSQSRVGGLVNMTLGPWNFRFNRWTWSAQSLADALGVLPDDLWPGAMREIRARVSSAEIEVTLDEMRAISGVAPDPAILIENKMVMEVLFENLTVREQTVVNLRMHGGTLRECAAVMKTFGLGDVTRSRIQQIEARAHRKIRRDARNKFGTYHVDELLHLGGE